MLIKRQTDKGLPVYSNTGSDTFITETGEELVRVEGLVGSNIQTFRLKNEGAFTRYRYIKEQDRWELIAKSGLRYFLGARLDNTDVTARIINTQKNSTYAWYLAEVRDLNNNQVLYGYEKDQNQVYCNQINYNFDTGTGSPSSGHQINLIYELRSDPVIDYRPTFRMVTAKRLKQIDIKTSGALVRRYTLDYLAGRTVSLLSRFTQFGADGVTSLPSAEFSYTQQALTSSSQLKSIAGLSGVSILLSDQNPDDYSSSAELIDFDGDALPDLYQSRHAASIPSEYDVVYKNLGKGSFERIALSASDSLGLKIQSRNSFVKDINGDGLVDLVAQKGSNQEDFVYRLNNSGKWAATDVVFNLPSGTTAESVFTGSDIRSVDLNFDKKIDTLRSYMSVGVSGTGVVFAAYFNKGDGDFDFIPQTTSDIVKGVPTTFSNANGTLVMADMNGDRLQDIVLLQDEISGGPRYWPSMGFGKFDDSTNGYIVPLTAGPNFNGQSNQIKKLNLTDLNGDGLADLYYISGSQVKYWLNEGGTHFGVESSIVLNGLFDQNYATYRLLDIDGDGLQEILFYVANSPTPDYLPLGFSYIRLFKDKTSQLVDNVDNDLDGLVDEADEGNSTPNLLASIINGIGKTTSLLYGPHVEDMLRDRDAGSSWLSQIPYSQSVLRQQDVYDGLNHYKTSFSYHDGYYDGEEKEFRGFSRAERKDYGDVTIPDLVTHYSFDVGLADESKKGKLLQTQVENAAGEAFYREIMTWETRILFEGIGGDIRKVKFPFAIDKVRDVIEKGTGETVSLKWEYDYDDYGNSIRMLEYGRLGNGWDDERLTVSTYSSAFDSGINSWVLDKLVSQVTSDENGQIASSMRQFYDNNSNLGEISKANLSKIENWVSGNNWQISTRNDYDIYGNIIATYDGLFGAAPGHYREYQYDSIYHTYPVKEIIHTGNDSVSTLEVSSIYDTGFGVMTSSTGFNNHITYYDYDTFGRLIAITKPGDSRVKPTTAYDYVLAHNLGNNKTINWVETRQRETADGGTVDSRTFFDGLGRGVMTRSEGENDGQVVVSETQQFNSRQLPHKKYIPYFESGTLAYTDPTYQSGFTEHHYDAIGREIKMIQPDGSFSSISYQPLQKITHDEEQTKATSKHYGAGMRYVEDGLQDKNGKGRLREVYEIVKISDVGELINNTADWKTTYRYDLLDNLTGYTDSYNNQKTIQYDGLSHKTFMNDPDRGVMDYLYDDANNLIKTKDAKGQVIRYQYDGINRLVKEFYSEDDLIPSVQYQYDSPRGAVIYGAYWLDDNSADLQSITQAILSGEGYKSELDKNSDNQLDVTDLVASVKSQQENNTLHADNTKGYLSWVKDLSGEEYNSYDERGRVSWVVKRIKDQSNQLYNFYTGMSYDSMDRVATLTYPDKSQVGYQYNSRGLLESIPGAIEEYNYNPAGQNLKLILSSGISTKYEYDHRLRLKKLQSIRNADSTALQDLAYNYDAVSNIEAITDNRSETALITIGQELGVNATQAQVYNGTQTFSYDSLYRLTQAKNDNVYGSIDYRYDRIGNMINKQAPLIIPDPKIDLGNMLHGGSMGKQNRIGRNIGDQPGPHAITGVEKGVSTISYDNNGNIIKLGEDLMQWDAKDRLVEFGKGLTKGSYIYDYIDNRKHKQVHNSSSQEYADVVYIDKFSEVRNGKLIKYIYAGSNRIARSGVLGSWTTQVYYLLDHLGTTGLTIGSDSQVMEQVVNYPFGNVRLQSQNHLDVSFTDYQFTGKELDVESGLFYFDARYLLDSGTFLSTDPYYIEGVNMATSDPQLLNTYTYVSNNTMNAFDPSGKRGRRAIRRQVIIRQHTLNNHRKSVNRMIEQQHRRIDKQISRLNQSLGRLQKKGEITLKLHEEVASQVKDSMTKIRKWKEQVNALNDRKQALSGVMPKQELINLAKRKAEWSLKPGQEATIGWSESQFNAFIIKKGEASLLPGGYMENFGTVKGLSEEMRSDIKSFRAWEQERFNENMKIINQN
jgi:RHS repeat-associated protein